MKKALFAIAVVATMSTGWVGRAFAGMPTEHVVRKADGTVETRGVYTRDSAGRVSKFQVSDGQGKALYTEVPYYSAEGHILRADRLLPDGSLDKVMVYLPNKALILNCDGAVLETQAFSQEEFFKARMNAEKLKVVASYEEFTALGLRAEVRQRQKGGCLLLVQASDPAKTLPEWMQAFYTVSPDAVSGQPLYEFDQKKPDRVSVLIGWADTMNHMLLVIAPVLREGEMLQDKPYVAIVAGDLIKWREGKKD